VLVDQQRQAERDHVLQRHAHEREDEIVLERGAEG
jgi:hypothetical protein